MKKIRHILMQYSFRNRDREFFVVLLLAYIFVFILLTIYTQFGTLFSRIQLADFEVGKIAESDIIVDRDIQFVDQEATELKREAKANLALPVFVVQTEISDRVLERFDIFSGIYLTQKKEGVSEEKLFFELQSALPKVFQRENFSAIASFDNPELLVKNTRSLLSEIMSRGFVSLPLDSRDGISIANKVEVWRSEKGQLWKEQVPVSDLMIRTNLRNFITTRLEEEGVSREHIRSSLNLIESIAEENTFFDEEQTQKNRTVAREEVQPVLKKLVKGERVIRKGFIVTEEDIGEIEQIGKYSAALNVNNLLGSGFTLILLFLLAFVLFSPPLVQRKLPKNSIYLIIGLGLSYLLITVVFLKLFNLPEWLPAAVIFPTALVAMLASILIGTQVAVYLVLILSLALLLITKLDALTFLFAFFSGIAGMAVIRNAEKRIELIQAGVFLGLLNVVFLTVFGFFKNLTLSHYLISGSWGFLNGFLCGIFNLGFLPVFEHLMNTPTRFRLMELSDLNSPILKRMLTLAPGTYNHSVNVANLAESACREIGANALLARVGAYYHDIGKIDQAEYFIENQTSYNKHDDLKPSLSVAVIKSHVKIGIEKAKEIMLPREIIDIIAQHHGKGLISYFYQRAVEKEGSERIAPEDFSYTGSPPTTKEAAVVMLADSVEAAARTLKRPTVAKLEKFVWTIIMDKFNSEQLAECDLTFKNLETIKKTFVQILSGHFHSRIEYPKVKESQK